MNTELYIAILIGGPIVLYLLLQLSRRQKVNRAEVLRQWAAVRSIASGDNPQFAVIEADKVFDSVLKQLGFKGDTMGERLKSAKPSLVNNNQVWSAHKLRNKLVHESDIRVKKTEVNSAISSFEKGLKGLGVL